MSIKTVAFAGNPNVGKSTVFNALTGLHQHTGNWTGKTVSSAVGRCETDSGAFDCVDLPGCYSLSPCSAEEEVSREYIYSRRADVIVAVCDATCLERSLYLVLQILNVTKNVIICVNLMDEAERKGISVNIDAISAILGVSVAGVSARNGDGVDKLTELIINHEKVNDGDITEENAAELQKKAHEICGECVLGVSGPSRFDKFADSILTGKWTAFPLMFVFFAVIFWITIVGANYPSMWLSEAFDALGSVLDRLLSALGANEFLRGILVSGLYGTSARVISVMLPPMAIFFPLFTALEDMGYLPRIAFNLDRCFRKCDACGKQALTMCMGFGCNAAGVVGCRIIDSPRERLIAILTNNFVPCNGRFPTLIAVITMFFVTDNGGISSVFSALILTAFVFAGVAMTFIVSKILSKTLLKGKASSFILELPPFRKPQLKNILVRSLIDRTLFVLGRAVRVAAPAGVIIWLIANVSLGDGTVLSAVVSFFEPVGHFLGFDGTAFTAFILGIPANEIVVPIMTMAYMAQGELVETGISELRALLISNGWTAQTAVCFALFSVFHWPCATALSTVRKEAGIKWAFASFLIPTVAAFIVCAVVAALLRLL